MKYLITGLGNPGSEYANTRHNIGFQVLDYIATQNQLVFKAERFGHITVWKHKSRQIVLLKPDTYMNLSGKAIHYWLQQEKVSKENLLVITDDLALPFGTIRLRGKGSDGGHNGLKSTQTTLGSIDYARLRFGIGSNFAKGHQADYVLSEWNEDEKSKLPERLSLCTDLVSAFCTIGIAHTMSQFNNK
jgi:PTH1 family peptidyl-tRNA hydrolase